MGCGATEAPTPLPSADFEALTVVGVFDTIGIFGVSDTGEVSLGVGNSDAARTFATCNRANDAFQPKILP